MRLARVGPVRNAYGGLAVLAAVAFFAFGLPALDRSLPADRPLEPGMAYPVGASVTLVPPAGAGVDLTRTRPAADRGTALFTLGDIRLAVVVAPYRGTLDDAAVRLRNKIAQTGAGTTGATQPAQSADGVPGVRGSYAGSGRAGAYAVFVHQGVVVEATASGSDAELIHRLPLIEGALASVSFGGAS
jgi:hypothetical protein